MKRISMVLAAVALVLGLSQCKKEEQPKVIEGEVYITLDVKADNGSKIDVNPSTGAVAFEYGDMVYVASGGKFVGTLTCGGTSFAGNITNPTTGEPLYFFFLANKQVENLIPGSTTTCSVDVVDQTSGKYPVISFAESNETFTGEGNYTAYFLNKAALVKFDVTTASPAPTCILEMNNKVTVDFSNNGFAFSSEGDGSIILPAGNGERWAIVLPQASGEKGACSSDGGYKGSCAYIPAIVENDYLTTGIEVNVSEHNYINLGLSSGTLWATCNVGADTPEGYGDYFAWGEIATKDTYNWSTYQYCMGSNTTMTKYCNNSSYGYNGFTDNLTTLLSEDDAVMANWGSDWRMPTKEEWQELYDNTTHTWTTQNGVSGCLFTATNGRSLFLPAAGAQVDSDLISTGDVGAYWSSSLYTNSPFFAWTLYLEPDYYWVMNLDRLYGFSVRAVRSVRQN